MTCVQTPQSFVQQETSHDIQDNCIQRWEDEGGTHNDGADRFHRRDSIDSDPRMCRHLQSAERLIAQGQYHSAFAEMERAAAHFRHSRTHIKTAFDQSIARLSTLDGAAMPPHPKTAALIKLRQTISA